MVEPTRKNSIQQALLYILNAFTICVSFYFELFPNYPARDNTQSLLATLQEAWSVWLLLPIIVCLTIAGSVAWSQMILAARIAFIVVIPGAIYYALRICGLFAFGFQLLFLPFSFLAYVLPAVSIYYTLAYSGYVLTKRQAAISFIGWLKEGVHSLPILLLLGGGVIPLALYLSAPKLTTEQYNMWWSDTSNSRCEQEVTLRFQANKYGQHLYTCSADLLDYLTNTSDETIPVVFEKKYRLGAWKYTVQQIGGRKGVMHFDDIFVVCSQSEAKCQNLKEQSTPFQQPYLLH